MEVGAISEAQPQLSFQKTEPCGQPQDQHKKLPAELIPNCKITSEEMAIVLSH